MKKLCLSILIMLMPLIVFADDPIEINGIYYNLITKAKIAEVAENPKVHYKGSVVIPEHVTYQGTEYTVTSIGDWAFYSCSALTSVTIPNSVASIGKGAFRISVSKRVRTTMNI